MNDLQKILIAGLIFLAIDFLYLSSFSAYFNNQVKLIQGEKINMKLDGAILCYILLIFGIWYFVLQHKYNKIEDALVKAFLLGFVIYGVYETTTYALLSNWKLQTVFIDSIWGGILFTLVTYIYFKFIN